MKRLHLNKIFVFTELILLIFKKYIFNFDI